MIGAVPRTAPIPFPDPDPTVALPLSECSACRCADATAVPAVPLPVAALSAATLEEALVAAYAGLGRGDTAAAEVSARAALVLEPDLPEANALIAEILAGRSQFDAAAAHYRVALADGGGPLSWQRDLAAALEAAGHDAEAVTAYREILVRRPDDAATHRRLARLLLRLGESETALEHAREARFLAPDRPADLAGLSDLAEVFVSAGEPLTAAEMLEPALRRADPDGPGLPAARLLLGRAWIALSETEKARRLLVEVLEAGGDAGAHAASLLAGLDGAAGRDLAPAYVRALFDRYADRFDTDLVGRLHYVAPQAIRAALLRLGLADGAPLRVLDAGCGTGLAGAELRSLAGSLAGFDLSPRMVEKARARGLYDELWVAELTAGLAARPGTWDLVVAADVLVYLGDLHPVMAAAAAALAPGGRFAFTGEVTDGDGFRLHEGRRYAHSLPHLHAALAAAGLTLELLEEHQPRWEKGRPVPGFLGVVAKPL